MEYYATKMYDDATLPTCDLSKDVGWDLYAHSFEIENYHIKGGEPISAEEVSLRPNDIVKVRTGVKIALPDGYGAFFWDRSGHGSRGQHRLAGVIDFSYRGELMVVLTNLSRNWYNFKKGDRIAQMVIQEVPKFEQIELSLEEFDKLETARGSEGFGSSGR